MTLEADYEYCRNIIMENSKTFYKAFSKLPERKRNAIYSVYAYCRTSDDIIDEENDLNKLMEYREELRLFQEGKEKDSPIWRTLRDVFQNYEMSIEPFYDMLEGQYRDAHFKNIETESELDSYCYYVAGTVGLMVIPILSEKHHAELRETAIMLGKAMQITNILRDVGEDHRKGRIYLSKEKLDKHGYSEEELKSGIIDSRFIALWEDYAEEAENLYEAVKSKYHLFDSDSLRSVKLASEYYRAILDGVRKNKYDCFSKRAYVSDFRKLRMALKIAIGR